MLLKNDCCRTPVTAGTEGTAGIEAGANWPREGILVCGTDIGLVKGSGWEPRMGAGGGAPGGGAPCCRSSLL